MNFKSIQKYNFNLHMVGTQMQEKLEPLSA